MPRLRALFFLLVLPLCWALAPLIPPAEAPDENVHVLRAESLLHGDLTGTRTAIPMPDRVHVEALLHGDPGLTGLMLMVRSLPPEARRINEELYERMRTVRWSGEAALFSAQTAVYPPVFYLPAALGLALARMARMIPFDALVAARIANAAFYVVAGTVALTIAVRGRLLLFATLALPMSVWLASAVHPDAPMLACVAIVVALTGRMMANVSAHGRVVARWVSAVLLGCVIALKPPLVPLVGLLLLPLRRCGWANAGAMMLALVIGLGWTGFAQQRASIPVIRGAPYQAGPLFPGSPYTLFRALDPVAQLSVLLADPTRLVTLPVRSLAEEAGEKTREVVGVLGQLDLPLPRWLYQLWFAALAAAILGDVVAARTGDGPIALESLLIVAIGVACLFATYLALYLFWTRVGAERIEGVQGRYFLPLLPLLGLALPRFSSAPALAGACALLLVTAILASACLLPMLTVRAFYLG